MHMDHWLANVERELIRLGVDALEARGDIDDNRDWFVGQFEAGDVAELAAQDWYNHHY